MIHCMYMLYKDYIFLPLSLKKLIAISYELLFVSGEAYAANDQSLCLSINQ